MSCTTCSGDEMKNLQHQWLKIQWKLKMPLAPEEQSICRKKQHHNKMAFKNEYIRLLELYSIPFKEQYLFEFYN